MNGEKLGKCQKKKCKGEYISYSYAGLNSSQINMYDGKCNKCGDLRCLPSPFSLWYRENHSIIHSKKH